MNIHTNTGEIITLYGENDLFDYIENSLGSDVVSALTIILKREADKIRLLQDELDCYSDSIRNLEKALLDVHGQIECTQTYMNSRKRINRGQIEYDLQKMERLSNLNKIEY